MDGMAVGMLRQVLFHRRPALFLPEVTALDLLLLDVTHAWRSVVRARSTTIFSVVILSFAIAAASTSFSLVNSALLRGLPYPDADRLVALSTRLPNRHEPWNSMPLEPLQSIRSTTRLYEGVAAYSETSVALDDPGGVTRLYVTAVDTATLRLLGARAARGRLFAVEEITRRAAVAVISDSLWRTRFHTSADILNSHVQLNGRFYSVIGVAAPGFRFAQRSDIWVPLEESPDTLPVGKARSYSVFGKLKAGVSLPQAEAELASITRHLAGDNENFKGWTLLVRSSLFARNRNGFDIVSMMFLMVTLLVLLIACVNIGNLQLARLEQRRRDMVLRAVLGASRARLARLAFMESALMGLAACLLSIPLTVWGIQISMMVLPIWAMPSWIRFGLDLRVVLFAAAASLLAAAVAAVAPGTAGTRTDLAEALKASADSIVADAASGRATRMGAITQIAVSFALFMGAALLVRSYSSLASADLGFDADRVISVRAERTAALRETDSAARLYREMAALLERDRRVEATALRGTVSGFAGRPAAFSTKAASGIYLPAQPGSRADAGLWPQVESYAVSDGYFQTLGMAITAGRGFGSQDVVGAPIGSVVSERLARHLWPGENPVSRTFTLDGDVSLTVIGIVSDVMEPVSNSAGSAIVPVPYFYVSERQAEFVPELLVRSQVDGPVLYPAINTAARAVDPSVRIASVQSLRADLDTTVMLVRVVGSFIGAFALGGLILAMVGTYGIVAFSVARRSREIGVRIALGGQPRGVVWLLVAQNMRPILVGVALGGILAAGVTVALRRVLYSASSASPFAYIGTGLLFLVVAAVACWFPARRAAQMEPLDVLRSL